MTEDEAKLVFGFDPRAIGNRFRSWGIIDTLEDEERENGVEAGDLWVRSRDGSSNPRCDEAYKKPNFICAIEDDFDRTYLIYYFKTRHKEGGE